MQEEMFFFIADISGYTEFMVHSQMEQTHAIFLINELMKALVKEIALPMEISKLEGDAIFFFLPLSKLPQQMQNNPGKLTDKILRFFSIFTQRANMLSAKTACDCGACKNVGGLNLKIVGHFGKAEIVKIGHFTELSGVDVILVHRLLKNHVKEKRYLLLTEPAYRRLALPEGAKIEQAEESDKDIGKIPVFVYFPPVQLPILMKHELSIFQKVVSHLILMLAPIAIKLGKKTKEQYHNLP